MSKKQCNKCKELKESTDFHWHRKGVRRSSTCKKCKLETDRKSRKDWRTKTGAAQKDKIRISLINKNELKDDYTNHFFSHFGFADYAPDVDVMINKPSHYTDSVLASSRNAPQDFYK